jgi:hypothetical protein
VARLLVPSRLSLTELNTILTGTRNVNKLTKKVLVLYTEIIKKMFKNGFKVEDPKCRFVQVGLSEREAIFRKAQVKVFDMLITNNFLEVLEGVNEETGEVIEVYKYGCEGSEAKRYAIPERFWGKDPKYHIVDDHSEIVKKTIDNLKKEKEKRVLNIEEQAVKEMVEVLKTVKFCKDKATQAVLSDNMPMKVLNTKTLGGLTLFDYIYFLNNDLYDEYAYQDYYGERLQHLKLNVPKILRYCSMYFAEFPHEPIAELDFANSQPFFLCCLTPEIVRVLLPEFYSEELADILTEMRQTDSFMKFQNSCIAGTLKEDFNTLFNDQFSKDEIKQVIFSVMYCNYDKRNKKYQKQLDAFKDVYPGIYEGLAKIKKLDWQHLKENCNKRSKRKGSYTNASLMIQRFESRVMLGHIVPRINKEITKTFFTIHDSVVCLERDKEKIEELIRKVFRSLGLVPPQTNNKNN